MADYEDEKENTFEHFKEVTAPILRQDTEESRSSIAFRPKPPNYVWKPSVQTHSEKSSGLTDRVDERPWKFSSANMKNNEEATTDHSDTSFEVKPYVNIFRTTTSNPLRKLYVNNQKEKLRPLYKDQEYGANEKNIETETLHKKRRLNRGRKKSQRRKKVPKGDIVIGKRKIDLGDDNLSMDTFTPLLKTDIQKRKEFEKKREGLMKTRTFNFMKKKENHVSNDYDDGEEEVIDQKAVESLYKRRSRPRLNLLEAASLMVTNRDEEEKDEDSESDTEDSFNQMSFWRKRFESERIKSFLSFQKKNKESKKQNIMVEDVVTSPESMTYVTNVPRMKKRGPSSFERAKKEEPSKYFQRELKPIPGNPPERHIKPFVNIESSKSTSTVVQDDLKLKAEALPFMSTQEKKNEDVQVTHKIIHQAQVGKFKEWSKRTGPTVIERQAEGMKKKFQVIFSH